VLVNEPNAGKPLTFRQIALHHLENHAFRNHGTKYLHDHIVKDYLIPRFGDDLAVEIKSKEILGWENPHWTVKGQWVARAPVYTRRAY
jgi:hypothetical protein